MLTATPALHTTPFVFFPFLPSVVDFDVFRDGFTFAYHFGERKSFSTRTAGAAAQTDPLRTR